MGSKLASSPEWRPNGARNHAPIVLVIHPDLFAGAVHRPYLLSLVRPMKRIRFLILTNRPSEPVDLDLTSWPENVAFVWRKAGWLGAIARSLPPGLSRVAGGLAELTRGLLDHDQIRNLRFDLVHVHGGVEVENLMRLGRKLRLRGLWAVARWLSDFDWTNRPVLLTEHSIFSRRSELGFPNPLHEADLFLASAFRNVICVDRDAYGFLTRHDAATGFPRRRWFIPNGIDVDQFAYRSLEDHRALRIGYAGRIFRSGESRTFLPELARRLPENVELHLAISKDLSVSEIRRLWFPGPRTIVRMNVPNAEMCSFYWSIDVLVNPLLWGGIGRSSLEAMSCGRPVALFANADRYPVSEETGYLVPSEDCNAFLSLVGRLADDRRDLERRGRAARAVIEREFTQERVAELTRNVYEDLLPGPGLGRSPPSGTAATG